MPEGPEISLITKTLSEIKNSILIEASLNWGKIKRTRKDSFKLLNSVLPLKIKTISCKGKYIWIELELYIGGKLSKKNAIQFIGFHLGMVGKFHINKTIKNHDNAIFKYKTKSKTHINHFVFTDYRNFGDVCVHTKQQHDTYLNKKIGPDINKIKKWETFRDIFLQSGKGKKLPIAHVLLMQDLVSGIGNYMRAEALYDAKISPYRFKTSLSNVDWKKLYRSLKDIYAWAIKEQVKEINYRKTNFKVYRQKKDPYNNTVTREILKNRSIYWVKKTQK